MGLRTAQEVRFDANGLGRDDDVVVDASGVVHFQKVKAVSTLAFDLTFPGITSAAGYTWACQFRQTAGSATPILGTDLTGAAQITITPNPDSESPETICIAVAAAGTALLAPNGNDASFVFDLEATKDGHTDRWVKGSGSATPEVTR
jgi:hypothetical protein